MGTSVRRLVALLLALPLLLLAGCGQGGSSDSSSKGSSGGSSGTATLPTVSGKFGEKPKITIPKAAPGDKLTVKAVTEGKGPKVTKDELVVAQYSSEIWRGTTSKPFDSSYDRKMPVGFPVGTGQLFKGLDQGLLGQQVGSRVLLVIPPAQAFGARGNPQAGVKPGDTIVFVMDLLRAYRGDAAAQGKQVSPDDGEALPVVKGGPGKMPTVTVPKGAQPPKKLVTKTLLQGDGPRVKKGQLLVAQYVGVVWKSGKQFDASWDRKVPASFPIGVGQVIKGWDEGLVGVKAGSRMLLVVPPEKGYGKKGQPQAGIKGDDTLVFVVDVLGSH